MHLYKFITYSLFFIIINIANAQTFTMPTVGVQNTYNGACPQTVCAGTFYDNGGAGSNYAANVNNIYRTFSTATPGMCLRAVFNSFSMNDTYFLCFGPNSCCDYMTIYDGPNPNSPTLYSNCTTSPGTITSTSGSLTFRFVSDGSVQLAGWSATLSCVPCSTAQAAVTNSDCINATTLTGNVTISTAAQGLGYIAEGCSGCMIGEEYSHWYTITPSSSGYLAFVLDPTLNSDDYNFALYGPSVTCGALGTPIRCSNAAVAGNGNTGIGIGYVGASEDVTGDQWVSELTVNAGETYYLLVNTNSKTANGYTLTFNGTASIAPVTTTTTLSSNINPSLVGQNVTFTANVLPNTATGLVNFKDGSTIIGSNALSGGVASFTTNVLTAGTHTITAEYVGGGIYGASTSLPLSHNVQIGVYANVKALLSGPYSTTNGLMDDSLRTKGYIPLIEPYSSMPYSSVFTHVNGGGGETTNNTVLSITGNNAIVDWVFLELRSKTDSTIVVATKSALIQRDGNIVDASDGVSPVKFDVSPDNYFVAVRHRNHLGIMSLNKYLLTGTATTINLTTAPLYTLPAPENNPLPLSGASRVQGGLKTLYAGNCNLTAIPRQVVRYNGYANDRISLLSGTNTSGNYLGYSVWDTDMNGIALFNGIENDRLVILQNVVSTNTVTVEQLPQ